MEWNDTLQNVLLVGGGAVALKVVEYVWQIINGVLGKRRTELDKMGRDLALAIADRDKQTLLKLKYREAIYILRAIMIKSGHWEEKDLPEEPPHE